MDELTKEGEVENEDQSESPERNSEEQVNESEAACRT